MSLAKDPELEINDYYVKFYWINNQNQFQVNGSSMMRNAGQLVTGCLIYVALVLLAQAQQTAPDDILAKSQEAYRALQSLHCQEQITTQMRNKGMDFTMETSATLKLGRPDLFRITWSQSMRNMPMALMNQGGAVWKSGKEAWLYMGVANSYSQSENTTMALAAATGISSGAAHTIPTIFFDLQGGNSILSMRSPKMAGSATIDGEACDIITGRGMGTNNTLWISKKSHLILKAVTVTDGGVKIVPKKMTDKDLDDALKAMHEEATPENRENLKKLMEHAQAATRDIQTTTTDTFRYIQADGKLAQKDFEFALPAGAAKEESIFGNKRDGATLKEAAKALDALKSAPEPEEMNQLEGEQRKKGEALKVEERRLKEQLDRALKDSEEKAQKN